MGTEDPRVEAVVVGSARIQDMAVNNIMTVIVLLVLPFSVLF